MESTAKRIHPLVATAAASVTLFSALGAAAILGWLPTSHSTVAAPAPTVAATSAANVSTPATPQLASSSGNADIVERKPVIHPHHVARRAPPASVQVAQAEPVSQYQAPAVQQPAPVAHNSPVGIGVGAVLGGLVGSQLGGGNGRTLATIAGAVGGGYVGNEIAKRNQ